MPPGAVFSLGWGAKDYVRARIYVTSAKPEVPYGRGALFIFLDQFRANYHSCYAIGYFVVFQLPYGRDVIVTNLRLRLFSKSSQLNKQ